MDVVGHMAVKQPLSRTFCSHFNGLKCSREEVVYISTIRTIHLRERKWVFETTFGHLNCIYALVCFRNGSTGVAGGAIYPLILQYIKHKCKQCFIFCSRASMWWDKKTMYSKIMLINVILLIQIYIYIYIYIFYEPILIVNQKQLF